jgi:hypothetical protein
MFIFLRTTLGLSSIFHCGLLRELSVRKIVSGSGAALNWIFGLICTSFWSKRDSIYFLAENAGRSQYSVVEFLPGVF